MQQQGRARYRTKLVQPLKAPQGVNRFLSIYWREKKFDQIEESSYMIDSRATLDNSSGGAIALAGPNGCAVHEQNYGYRCSGKPHSFLICWGQLNRENAYYISYDKRNGVYYNFLMQCFIDDKNNEVTASV